MSREDDLALMYEYTQSDSLIKHMLAVECAMVAYARKLGEDVDKWATVGLLHDFDYERWPDPPVRWWTLTFLEGVQASAASVPVNPPVPGGLVTLASLSATNSSNCGVPLGGLKTGSDRRPRTHGSLRSMASSIDENAASRSPRRARQFARSPCENRAQSAG